MHELLQGWMPAIEVAGFIVTALTVILLRRKTGAEEVSGQIITTYKLRVEQLEQNENRNNERMHEHTKEIGQLQGELREKDKQLIYMRSILENRNPELTEVLKDIRSFMKRIEEHMTEIKPAPQLDVT